jgi:hypothetical protein
MTNNIPIYNTLLSSTSNIDLTIEEKNNFMVQIKKCDIQGYKTLYILIVTYHMNNNEETSNNFPYGGSIIKEEMRFDLDKLPFKLKQILYIFITKHFNPISI